MHISVHILACENSRPSSLPARVAFRVTRNASRAGSEEGRLFSQAVHIQSETLFHFSTGWHILTRFVCYEGRIPYTIRCGSHFKRLSLVDPSQSPIFCRMTEQKPSKSFRKELKIDSHVTMLGQRGTQYLGVFFIVFFFLSLARFATSFSEEVPTFCRIYWIRTIISTLQL